MRGRSPARFLAPIAILAFAFAVYTVVHDARKPAGGNSSSGTPTQTATPPGKKSSSAKKSKKKTTKVYVVKSGDTLSGIAEKTGVSAATLQRLNSKLDPQTLSPGQRLRLSK